MKYFLSKKYKRNVKKWKIIKDLKTRKVIKSSNN